MPTLVFFHTVHFADDSSNGMNGTYGQVMELLRDCGTPEPFPASPVNFHEHTLESLLEDESEFESVFNVCVPGVYIEGGEHDAADLAPFFAKYGDRIEAWVRNGGRLLVNASPCVGRCPLPFGAALVGGAGIERVESWGFAYSQFYCDPTPLEGGAIVPRDASGLVSTGYIDFDYEAMPYQRSLIAADSWGTMAGDGYGSVTSVSVLVPEGALGSAIYASLRGPGMLRMAVDESAVGGYPDPTAPNVVLPAPITHDDGAPFWNRLFYWAFRSDGFAAVPGTEPCRLVVTAADSVSYESASATVYAMDIGTNGFTVAAEPDVDWLVISPASADIPPGPFLFASGTNAFTVALADGAASLPVGVHTGAVTLTRSLDFAPDGAARWYARFAPDLPLVDPYVDTFPSAFRVEVELVVEEEDDEEPLPVLDAGVFHFVGQGQTVAEADGVVARIAVVREGSSLPAASILLRTEDDTARAGLDYTAVSNRLCFAAGVATNVVEIPILDNALLHTYSPATVAPRSFFVRLSEPSSGATLGTPANYAVAILDDEVPPRSWYVRPASGGWDAADTADLRALLTAGGLLPPLDIFTETTFEAADPDALFSTASSCVFLDFGPRDVDYAASYVAPWRAAIEAWVRAGGRLFLNTMPAEGTCDLPFGLVADGSQDIDSMGYYIYDTLPMAPTPIMGPSDYLEITPAAGISNVSEASIILPASAWAAIQSDGGNAWHGNSDGWSGSSYGGPYLVVTEGAGSATFASVRPPAQLFTSVASPTILWQRMLLWAFRPDGFGLVATEEWRPEGVVGEPGTFAPSAKTYGVVNLGVEAIDVTVSNDVPWLVAESDAATVAAGYQASFRISLAPEALSFPAGVYTGTVFFASTRPFCENVDIGGWGTLTYPAPEFRRQVVLAVLPPSGTLAPIEVSSAVIASAHPGATGARTVVATLENLSSEHPVRLLSWSLSGDEAFRLVSPASFPAEIPAGGSLELAFAFAPTALGPHRATVTLETSDRDHPEITLTLTSRSVPLRLESPVLWDGARGCEIRWTSVPDAIYDVLSTDDLSQPFERIGKTVGDDGSTTLFFDTRPHADSRFYRIRLH